MLFLSYFKQLLGVYIRYSSEFETNIFRTTEIKLFVFKTTGDIIKCKYFPTTKNTWLVVRVPLYLEWPGAICR